VILVVFIALIVIFVVLPIVGVALWWLISTIVVGLLVGALGRLIVPGRNPIGFWATVACGLIGALLGGALGRALGHGRLLTILVEIAVSAGAVAVWSATHRSALPGTSRRPLQRRF